MLRPLRAREGACQWHWHCRTLPPFAETWAKGFVEIVEKDKSTEITSPHYRKGGLAQLLISAVTYNLHIYPHSSAQNKTIMPDPCEWPLCKRDYVMICVHACIGLGMMSRSQMVLSGMEEGTSPILLVSTWRVRHSEYSMVDGTWNCEDRQNSVISYIPKLHRKISNLADGAHETNNHNSILISFYTLQGELLVLVLNR